GRRQRERLDALGDEVDDALDLLEATADEQRTRGARDAAVTRPQALRADDVEEPGLVLQVEEGGALGGGRTLPVRDHSSHEHPGAVLDLLQRIDAHGTERVAAGARV